jgi:membrane-bound lytic murein transglycosylase A
LIGGSWRTLRRLNARTLQRAGLALLIAAAPILSLPLPSPAKAEAKAKADAESSKKPARAKVAKKRAAKAHPLKIPNSTFEGLAWHEIKGWIDDDHGEAFSAFLASCKPILRSS